MAKNTICLWYDGSAEEAANFYAKTFPNSSVSSVQRAPGDFPNGKQGQVLGVEFTVVGIPCFGHFRSSPKTKLKPIGCGTQSSTMAGRKAPAVGAKTSGASHGRSLRAH